MSQPSRTCRTCLLVVYTVFEMLDWFSLMVSAEAMASTTVLLLCTVGAAAQAAVAVILVCALYRIRRNGEILRGFAAIAVLISSCGQNKRLLSSST